MTEAVKLWRAWYLIRIWKEYKKAPQPKIGDLTFNLTFVHDCGMSLKHRRIEWMHCRFSVNTFLSLFYLPLQICLFPRITITKYGFITVVQIWNKQKLKVKAACFSTNMYIHNFLHFCKSQSLCILQPQYSIETSWVIYETYFSQNCTLCISNQTYS